MTCFRKGNFMRETESLLATQNNAIRTNYDEAKIDKTKQKSKCRFCSDIDEVIIISECGKLAEKECQNRDDLVRKVILWELCKKFKFDHTNK